MPVLVSYPSTGIKTGPWLPKQDRYLQGRYKPGSSDLIIHHYAADFSLIDVDIADNLVEARCGRLTARCAPREASYAPAIALEALALDQHWLEGGAAVAHRCICALGTCNRRDWGYRARSGRRLSVLQVGLRRLLSFHSSLSKPMCPQLASAMLASELSGVGLRAGSKRPVLVLKHRYWPASCMMPFEVDYMHSDGRPRFFGMTKRTLASNTSILKVWICSASELGSSLTAVCMKELLARTRQREVSGTVARILPSDLGLLEHRPYAQELNPVRGRGPAVAGLYVLYVITSIHLRPNGPQASSAKRVRA
jgi:hypothetical protein